jgi:hypothetical protein
LAQPLQPYALDVGDLFLDQSQTGQVVAQFGLLPLGVRQSLSPEEIVDTDDVAVAYAMASSWKPAELPQPR